MNLSALLPLGPGTVVLIKWSLLLGLGWLTHAALRHRQPRARMILWRSILCAGVALPLLQFAAVPTLEIPVPAALEVFHAAVVPAAEPGRGTAGVKPALAETLPQPGEPPSMPPGASNSRGPKAWPSTASVLWSIWFLGFSVAGLRLVRSWAQLCRVQKGAETVDGATQRLAEDIRRELGVRGPVTVRSGEAVGAPFVCGLLRPAIFLPAKLALSRAELQALLRHEMAHVRRHDVPWHFAWKCMQALCWFHPMVWAVPRTHQLASEQEADRIASREQDPCAYAGMLADIAMRLVPLPSPECGAALNATSQLVQRLKHLIGRRPGPWTRRHGLLAYAISGLLVCLASGWSLAQRRASAAPAPALANSGSKELLILVQDENGKPVGGAVVQPYAFRVKGRSADHYGWDRQTRPTLVTDEEGEAHLSYPVEAFPKEKLLTTQISITISHPDFSPTTAHLEVQGPAQPVRLARGLTLQVTGVGPAGQPVPELVANLSGEPQVVWRTNAPGGLVSRQVSSGGHLLQLMGRLASGEIVYSEGLAFTGEQGAERETFRMGSDEVITVPKGKPFLLTLGMRPGIRLEGQLDTKVPRPIKEGRVVISVRPKQIPAYVVPEEGAELHRQYGSFLYWTSHRAINEDGTFVFESIPPGEVDVVVHGEGFVSKNGGHPHNLPGSSSLVIGVPQAFALREPVTRIEVITEPTATLDVTVKTASGQPVEGATVYTGPNVMRMRTGYLGGITRSSEAAFGPVEPLSETPAAYSGRTDRNGRVVLRDIPAVARLLDIEHPQFEVPLPEKHGDRNIRFQLVPGKVEKLSVIVQRKGTDFIGEDR